MLLILIKITLTLEMFEGGTEFLNTLTLLVREDAVSMCSISVAVEILELKWTVIHRDDQWAAALLVSDIVLLLPHSCFAILKIQSTCYLHLMLPHHYCDFLLFVYF